MYQDPKEIAKTVLMRPAKAKEPDFSRCHCLADIFVQLGIYIQQPEFISFKYGGEEKPAAFVAMTVAKTMIELWQWSLRERQQPYSAEVITPTIDEETILYQVTGNYELRTLVKKFIAQELNSGRNYFPFALAKKVLRTYQHSPHDLSRHFKALDDYQQDSLRLPDFSKCVSLNELFSVLQDELIQDKRSTDVRRKKRLVLVSGYKESLLNMAVAIRMVLVRRDTGEKNIDYDSAFKDFSRNCGLRQKLIDLCSAEPASKFPEEILDFFGYKQELREIVNAKLARNLAELQTSFFPPRPPERREVSDDNPPCQMIPRKEIIPLLQPVKLAPTKKAFFTRDMLYSLLGMGAVALTSGAIFYAGGELNKQTQQTAPTTQLDSNDKYRTLTPEEQANFINYAQAAHGHYFPYMRELMRNSKTCLQKDGTVTQDCAAALKDLDLVEQGLTWFEQHPEQLRGYYEPIGTGQFDYGQSGMTMSGRQTPGDFSDDQLSVNLYFFRDTKGGKVEEITHELGHCWSVGLDHTGDIALTDWSADIFGKLIIDGKDYSYYLTALGTSLDNILAIHMKDVRTKYNKGTNKDKLVIRDKDAAGWSRVLAKTYEDNYHALDAFTVSEAGIASALRAGKIPELANELTQEYISIKESGDTGEVQKKSKLKLR